MAQTLPARVDARSTLSDLLEKMKPQMAKALPRHMRPERMIRLALTAWSKTPQLQECTPNSIISCVMQASQLGLEIDGVLGHAYLVPFRNNSKGITEAQFIAGYKGLLNLAMQSGELSSTPEAQAVYKGDRFSFAYGTSQHLEHEPAGETENPFDITHVWALARFKGGGMKFQVMTRAAVERIRQKSRAKNAGPWVNDFEQMALKTVLRRLCKGLPMSVEGQRQVAREELLDSGADVDMPVFDELDGEEAAGQAIEHAAGPEQQKQPEKLEEKLRKKSGRKNHIDELTSLCGPADVESICAAYNAASLDELPEHVMLTEIDRLKQRQPGA